MANSKLDFCFKIQCILKYKFHKLRHIPLDRDLFARQVREVASPDVGKMGIEILSFTIKDVSDDCHYLDSLGKAQIAEVKKNADVGVAEANRDAGIRVRLLKCSTNILCKREKNFD